MSYGILKAGLNMGFIDFESAFINPRLKSIKRVVKQVMDFTIDVKSSTALAVIETSVIGHKL